ncbi:MAG: glutamate synthase, partial [Candidatus Marinimicrobia bacterium]|nr:glutamate synthase [Candidatus Neomarinimicrobiota bacterium]
MSKISGFIDIKRQEPGKQEVANRIRHFREFETPLPYETLIDQAARCMDCGIPYCHACGCPLGNLIPDWNNMVHRGHWQRALELLHATNNFPEITGRICPALCESACSLAINQEPVLIKHIELQIAEKGWQEGWIKPQPASVNSNKRVA